MAAILVIGVTQLFQKPTTQFTEYQSLKRILHIGQSPHLKKKKDTLTTTQRVAVSVLLLCSAPTGELRHYTVPIETISFCVIQVRSSRVRVALHNHSPLLEMKILNRGPPLPPLTRRTPFKYIYSKVNFWFKVETLFKCWRLTLTSLKPVSGWGWA